MAVYLLSDVHLRLDRPDRGERLATFVDVLKADDRLIVVGDLCDFWFAARQWKVEPLRCPGLKSLARFRDRGGATTLLVGNHDAWLGPYYEKALDAKIVVEPFAFEAFGLRVVVAHGHLLGARRWWKGAMESKAFLNGFALLPRPLAGCFEHLLDAVNERGREESNRRHLALYRGFADSLADRADLVALGHIHDPFDDQTKRPRMIVLGGWHRATTCLKIDHQGATALFQSASKRPELRRHDGDRDGKTEE